MLIGAMMALHGFGVGLAQQVPVIGVQNAAPARDVGAATGSVTLSRMGGASIAISIYGCDRWLTARPRRDFPFRA